MTRYVLVYARSDATDEAVLIRKLRPSFLAGLYNLPGGKIEPDESVEEAALRELKEETGLRLSGKFVTRIWTNGSVSGDDSVIYCVKVMVAKAALKPRSGEDEPVTWADLKDITEWPDLAPNLRLIIPLMEAGATGWKITDQTSWAGETHTVQLELADMPPVDVVVRGLAHF